MGSLKTFIYPILVVLMTSSLITSCTKPAKTAASCENINYDRLNKAVDDYIFYFNSRKFDSLVTFYPPFFYNYFYKNFGYAQNPNAIMPNFFFNRWIYGYRIEDSLNNRNKLYLPYAKFNVDTSMGFYDHCFCNGDTLLAWTKIHYEKDCFEKDFTKKEYFTKFCPNGRIEGEELLLCISFNGGLNWYLINPDREHDDNYRDYTFVDIDEMKEKHVYDAMRPLFSEELMQSVFNFWFFPKDQYPNVGNK